MRSNQRQYLHEILAARHGLAVIIALMMTVAVVGVSLALSLGNADGQWSNPGGGPTCLFINNSPTNSTNQNIITAGRGTSRCPTSQSISTQSGFGFDGSNGPLTFAPSNPFLLGEFTHYNNPIYSGTGFSSADLSLALAFADPVASATLKFFFTLDETPNSVAPCAYGDTVPCGDGVTVTSAAGQSFTVGGIEYVLDILGWIPGKSASCVYDPIRVADFFFSDEQAFNSACLFGRMLVNAPSIALDVTSAPEDFGPAGSTVVFNYAVTNNGTVALSGPVSVTSDKGPATCPAVHTTGNRDTLLDSGESVTCTTTYTVTQADVNAGTLTSTAAASVGSVTSTQVQSEVTISDAAALSLTTSAQPTTVAPLAVAQITLNVANPSNTSISGPIVLRDYLPGGFTFEQLSSVTVNGAAATASVNDAYLNQPEFTVNQAIAAGQSLVLVFTATVPANAADGQYCSNFKATVAGIVTSSNDACVTVSAAGTGTGIVQSGSDGGLESEPLPGDPSAFIGGIGTDAVAAATLQQAQTVHKARLLEAMSLNLDDLMPSVGPAGTTPQPAVPVDVFAVTNAPDAQAVDFVDATGQVKAVALGINSVGSAYEHDYGVCNRFKEFLFDAVEPVSVTVDLPTGANAYWFWRSHASRGADVREDALIFHIFVDEANHRLHIDSRWTSDGYDSAIDFPFDYVFNMQVWSTDTALSQELLRSILTRLAQIDDGAWELQFHNTEQPAVPQVFIAKALTEADTVSLRIHNATGSEQTVQLRGSWRSYLDRNTSIPIDMDATVPAGDSKLNLTYTGLLDASIYLAYNGFEDKIYTGSGLWFDFSNSETATTELSTAQCRSLGEIDPQDLLLAGCTDMVGADVSRVDEVGLGRTINPNGRPIDVSPYQALRFWAKGDGTAVRLLLESAGITDGDYYQTVFTPDSQWRQYIIPFAEFRQRGFGAQAPFTRTDIKSVVWSNAEFVGSRFELSIDQVTFTNNALTEIDLAPENNGDTAARTISATVSDGHATQQMSIFYSLDGGAHFHRVGMTGAAGEGGVTTFTGQLPGQQLGTDILYYLETVSGGGYVGHSPVDAPSSLYRYRVDDRHTLLVDDFAAGRLVNRLRGTSGIFNNQAAGGRVFAYRTAQQLVLDYDVSQDGQYAGFFSRLNGLDAGGFTTLDLLVRGETGGEQALIGLRDSEGNERKVNIGDLLPGGVTTSWQWVQIPLSSFDAALDRTALSTMSVTFDHGYAPSTGRLSIKEVRFTSLPTPIIIDTFDDADGQHNAQGKAYVVSAPSSVLNSVYEQRDPATSSGHALRLEYQIGAGGYAVWRSPLNDVQVAEQGSLSFWVKGAAQAIMPNLYLGDGTARGRVALADYVELSDAWQQVQIPLSLFAGQGVNLQHLTAFEIAFEFSAGAGVLWMDNISIGTPGVPQVDRRVLHLYDNDRETLALHVADGTRWQGWSDAGWLSAPGWGYGPASIDVRSQNAGMQAGVYTGLLTVQGQGGAVETVTVHLTLTASGAAQTYVYLPIVSR